MTIHQVRRVVTGGLPDGKSVFSSDGAPPLVIELDSSPGNEFFMIWGTDDVPQVPTDGADPTPSMESFSPARTARASSSIGSPPGWEPTAVEGTIGTAEEFANKMPGISESLESKDPMMHTTDTIDYGIVLSGEMWLELDDGMEAHLTVGDCIIQNGTRHAWRNRGSEPCVMAFVMVGARR